MIGNWPCYKPPWGRLIAVNASTGDFAWQVPLGITESLPEGKQNTGVSNLAGPIATAGGLVFVGATSDNRFRAFDSKTGKELWVTKLDYTATADADDVSRQERQAVRGHRRGQRRWWRRPRRRGSAGWRSGLGSVRAAVEGQNRER